MIKWFKFSFHENGEINYRDYRINIHHLRLHGLKIWYLELSVLRSLSCLPVSIYILNYTLILSIKTVNTPLPGDNCCLPKNRSYFFKVMQKAGWSQQANNCKFMQSLGGLLAKLWIVFFLKLLTYWKKWKIILMGII